jgi:hypothetical protein
MVMSTKVYSVINGSDGLSNTEENTGTLLQSHRNSYLEINPEEAKYFSMSRYQNAGHVYLHPHNNSQ